MRNEGRRHDRRRVPTSTHTRLHMIEARGSSWSFVGSQGHNVGGLLYFPFGYSPECADPYVLLSNQKTDDAYAPSANVAQARRFGRQSLSVS